ncbi:hypothetical protein V5799_020745 [Amblyomma americanum]
MKGEYMVLCFFLLVSVAHKISAEPACPQVYCLPPHVNVACFITDRECQCGCVAHRDPCAPLQNRSCPAGRYLSCNRNGNECKCRCVRK